MLPDTITIQNEMFRRVSVSPVLYNGWRVLHDKELGALWRVAPEVMQLEPEHRTEFGQADQILSYQINTTVNPLITADIEKKKWRVLHNHERAFHNGGVGFDGGQPLADYVNRTNLTSPNPKWHRPLVCGGAFLHGVVNGN